ncbi:DUF3362 domain-containing protein [Serratia ureilytica]
MYYSGKNPLSKVGYKSEDVVVPRGERQRRLHKALLRYHDPANWALIRAALEEMGLKHLIGSRRDRLVPAPSIDEQREAKRLQRAMPAGADQTYRYQSAAHRRPAGRRANRCAKPSRNGHAAGASKRRTLGFSFLLPIAADRRRLPLSSNGAAPVERGGICARAS